MYTIRKITGTVDGETISLPIVIADSMATINNTFDYRPIALTAAAVSADLLSLSTTLQQTYGFSLRIFDTLIYDKSLYDAYQTNPTLSKIWDGQRDAGMFSDTQLMNADFGTAIVSNGQTVGYYCSVPSGIAWKVNSSTSAAGTIARFRVQAYSSPVYYLLMARLPIFPSEVVVDGKLDLSRLPGSYGTIVQFLDFFGYVSTAISGNFMYGNVEKLAVTGASANIADMISMFGTPPVLDAAETEDPYTGAGYSPSTAPGGYSSGSFNFTESGIGTVHTPSKDLLDCGLITAWQPSKAILSQLAGWLWVTTPSQILQQIFGNPINAIIGLSLLPVSPAVDGGTNHIKFGVEDSGVSCPKITSQYVTVDCGTLHITPKYGSYMDYAPQTSAELFLPYVGGVPIDVNDVMDKTISIKYQVDVLSGACVAYVFIEGTLHYQRAGSCAATAPITGSQMPNVLSGALSIVGSLAGALATSGAGGASTAAKVASGIATGTKVADSTANMLKQQVSYSGTIAGWAGLLSAQTPYLILTMPNAAVPGNQQTIMGYPAWVGGRLGNFRGYTECYAAHVDASRATDAEVEEINEILRSGVIL